MPRHGNYTPDHSEQSGSVYQPRVTELEYGELPSQYGMSHMNPELPRSGRTWNEVDYCMAGQQSNDMGMYHNLI